MLKKKLRLTSLDNSGKGVKWNYPEAADLSEDERTLAEVTTRANIAVWLVARGNKSLCESRGPRRKGLDMKGKAVVLVLAGVGVMAGMALSAGATEDLWSYELAADGAGDQVYQFRDVELTIPADWDGKYGLEVDEDANFPYGTVSVYHKASQEALSAEYGQENTGGYLFTLTCSDDYDFMDVLPSYRIIGETDGYVYYVSLPTDVQGYMEDDAIWAEWLQLSGDTDWVVSNITVTNPGEGVVDMDQLSQNASDAAQDADYILPNSSTKYLSESDLSGMSADELQMAINEIYARHHRKFVTKSIQQYFDGKGWYSGTIAAEKFDVTVLNQYENENIALMLRCMSKARTSQGVSSGTGSATAASGMQMTVTATVNIRSKTTTSSPVMGIVPQGYTVTALGTAVNGWVPVNYNGIRGYISQDYLKTGAGMSTDSSENIANNNRVNTPSSNTENADQSQNDTDGVVAAVQVYAGRYAESSIYEGIPMEQMPDYYTLNISNVTETTFDFSVNLVNRASNGVKCLLSGTAEFTGDGSEAVCYGGRAELAGKVMVNHGVPGHEFS